MSGKVMPHKIGFVDNSNGVLAHYNMLEEIKNLAVASGFWQVMRYDTANEIRELILKGCGYTGTEEIYVGLKTYHNVAADYYNLAVSTFTGYVASNTYDTQPSVVTSGVPAHNLRIDYWLTINPQRIACCMKVGTPVYEHFYIGKFFPYARPSQYPYPIVCAGMLNGIPATRYSDGTHSFPYAGNRVNLKMRFNTGIYLQPYTYPYKNTAIASATEGGSDSCIRDTNDYYPLIPIILYDTNGIYGELDGVRYVSGFNNTVENTCDDEWVILQDVWRTSFITYIALKMDK